MNNHFTITITDEHGVKQFNLSKIIKKAFLYASLFLVFFIVVSLGTIYYLNISVEESEAKKEQIHKAYVELKEKNEKLLAEMQATQQHLEAKKTELEEVSSSLAEIETLIGLKPSEDLSLQQRVDLTKLSSENIATILQFIPNGSPIEYKGITSKYGWRVHPTLHKREFHPGSDMRAKLGTPVYATADGVVEYAGYHKRSGYGKLIIIDNNYGFKTYFGHLNKIKVKAGQFIKKGDLVALSGNTGLSNGPHLHYEVRFIQRPLNPFWFIKWGVENFNEIFQKEKRVPWQSLIAMMANLRIKPQIQVQPSSQSAQTSKGK
jgi:murein DD-endopeptidase MepM/ murein hydrolase activator NlpD